MTFFLNVEVQLRMYRNVCITDLPPRISNGQGYSIEREKGHSSGMDL